ncbi:hypothetical protein QI633_05615 [Nocardioides sp. QY071]|uniref:hypothetical protein n=1 Tax=Nocardioides sp. QY071 TaxID=3044187 RepID=UPI00249A42DD|nr:hypothetical protein [Nocardioides sp. QY071]WGY03235.1 hypothetical protein QI633_05615 [Nocardioides sp. QY071]
MKVRDPEGGTWRVTRRWVPWRRRLRSAGTGPLDGLNGLGDDPVSAVIAIVLLVLALPFIILALFVAFEFVLLLLLIPFAALARVALGAHWTIEARRGFTIWWDAPSGDWRESGERIREVAHAIGEGRLPPRTVGADDDGE